MSKPIKQHTRHDTRGTVREVTILLIYDEYASPKDWLFQDDDYKEEDQKRYDAWLNDEWYLLGVRVRVYDHNWQTGNTCVYESAGLWGIESDSEDSYFTEVAEEQLAELKAEYPQLADVTLDNAERIHE